jgi:hypothetical protein
MAQDVVCRGDMEKELRDTERQQQRSTSEISLRAIPEHEDHLHVGIEPRIEQDRGIDLARFSMSGGMIEKIGQTAQKLSENADRRSVYREGRRCCNPVVRRESP